MRRFRRCNILYFVAWILVILGASPVTAPFSTFSAGDATQHGATELKTFDALKTGHDKAIDVVGTSPDSGHLRAFAAVIADNFPHPLTASRRHDVLRI